ncbi:hypothetical protein [Streptomyces luteireticuli]|uniref:hypothetical protein n=1 Tax=Streptomyces luteireticuli TaxID=173858 RepID=UPI0035581F15
MSTTLTPEAPDTASAGTRRPGPRGMAWMVLRQHRATVFAGIALVVVMAVQLVLLRWAMTDYLHRHGLDGGVPDWTRTLDDFRGGYGDVLHYNGLVLEFLPLLVGLLVAGPMVARELESGTYQLAWTQSVPPLRWLAAKLAVPVVFVLAGVSLLSAVYTWTWSAVPYELLPGQTWYELFDALGPAPVANALLGIALGVPAGLLARRTLPAMGITLVAYGLVQWALTSVRPYLISPVTSDDTAMPGLSGDDSWRFERGILTRTGERIVDAQCDVGVDPVKCLAQHHADRWYLDYHPASHLWPLQWAEAGLTLAAAALAAAAAVRWFRRRHA